MLAGGVHQVQDLLEAGGVAVIGGRHVAMARIGVVGEKESDLGSGVFRPQRFQEREMTAVLGEDQVEAGEVSGCDLACAPM